MVKFSHKYSKMPEGWEKSRLLQVFTIDKHELSSGFEAYDTHIMDRYFYDLPSGKLVVLLLQTIDREELWTTIRRYTSSKYHWYMGLMGQTLKMEIVKIK